MSRPEEASRPPETAPSIPSAAARLGPSCLVNGDLEAKEDVVVQGTFKGRVRLPAHGLYVDKTGDVQAEVVAAQVVIFGRVAGNIQAGGRVFLAAGARMKGDIAASRVSIQDGAQFQGHIKIDKGA
ncbi:MAG: polymer-forming cytoskeletal protein [Candidatus Aminicenantes bacterium]|nr:polymer-forming cytoskeletal protein [Candidatus Aminicenantes bacterium]